MLFTFHIYKKFDTSTPIHLHLLYTKTLARQHTSTSYRLKIRLLGWFVPRLPPGSLSSQSAVCLWHSNSSSRSSETTVFYFSYQIYTYVKAFYVCLCAYLPRQSLHLLLHLLYRIYSGPHPAVVQLLILPNSLPKSVSLLLNCKNYLFMYFKFYS